MNDSINIYCLFFKVLVQYSDMKALNLFIITLFFSTNLYAYKHLKTSNYDLRSEVLILSIDSTDGSFHRLYQSVGDEFFLDKKAKDKSERIRVSNITAAEYDKYFVSQFIHLKYSLPNFKGKNCSKSFTLSMRGETQDICKDEKEKLLVMEKVINKIKKIYLK